MLSCIYYIQIGSFLLCFKIGYARTKEIVYRKSHGILLKWSIVSSTPNVKMSYNVVKIVEFHISTHKDYTHNLTLLAFMYLVQFLSNFKVGASLNQEKTFIFTGNYDSSVVRAYFLLLV